MGQVIKWPRQIRAMNQPGPTHESSTDGSRLHNNSSETNLQIHNHHVVQYYYDVLLWCTIEMYYKQAMRSMIDELRHQRGLPR